MLTIVLAIWCLGFGYFVREWTSFESWHHRVRAVVAAVMWPVFLILLVMTPPVEEVEEEPWQPPPPVKPPERLFPDDEW